MSILDAKHRKRSVVPRWRSFLNTPSVELVTANRFPDAAPITSAQFNDMLKIWETSGKIEDYVDIMDAGIASGSRFLAVKGARKIASSKNLVRHRVVERAEGILFGKPNFLSTSDLPMNESVREEVFSKISRLKNIITESPRNALTHIEIARLYCRLAQFDPAERHVALALILAPDDRFVLRSSTRFYTMLDEGMTALLHLRRSQSVRYDPWVQSAELAAAELEGREARFADKAARSALSQQVVGRDQSELASGWLSRQRKNNFGGKQALRQLARVLRDATENALAQGVWLIDSTEGDFSARFPNVTPSADAHEAKSILLADKREFREARDEAAKWFIDQPFQARACIHLVFLNFVHLRDYEAAQNAAEAGLLIHSDDWMLLNLAALANAYIGEFERAGENIQALSRVAEGDEQLAFLHAAKGMLAIEKGRFDDGLAEYSRSIALSKSARRPDLVVNAVVYMIEVAAKKGFVSPEEFDQLNSHIEKSISRLSPSMRRDATETWVSRKLVICQSLDQFDFPRLQSLSPDIIERSLVA